MVEFNQIKTQLFRSMLLNPHLPFALGKRTHLSFSNLLYKNTPHLFKPLSRLGQFVLASGDASDVSGFHDNSFRHEVRRLRAAKLFEIQSNTWDASYKLAPAK